MTLTTPAPKKPKPKVTEDIVIAALLLIATTKDNIDCSKLIKTSCFNVFDNKWRVNFWVGINNPIVPNAGRILKSYFVKLSDCGLEILEN